MASTLNEEQKDRLRQAHNIIADVQIELFAAEDREELKRKQETWRDLHWVRAKLIEFMYYGHLRTSSNGAGETHRNYVEV
jgi:hypothetical protein